MPRANRYFVAGKVYHLTHRCHNRDFLFRFARDRSAYRQLLWKSLREFPVSVFGYSITSNHTHLIVRSELSDAVSAWMQQLEGQFAQAYNRRKGRSRAFWEDRYHCTMVDRGMHLWNCIVYVELNMVRAGVVRHPSEWLWCSYQEWSDCRQRYRVVDVDQWLDFLGASSLKEFQNNIEQLINEALSERRLTRQPQWTEAIAVGSSEFVQEIQQSIHCRQWLDIIAGENSAWMLKEQVSIEGLNLNADNGLKKWP